MRQSKSLHRVHLLPILKQQKMTRTCNQVKGCKLESEATIKKKGLYWVHLHTICVHTAAIEDKDDTQSERAWPERNNRVKYSKATRQSNRLHRVHLLAIGVDTDGKYDKTRQTNQRRQGNQGILNWIHLLPIGVRRTREDEKRKTS